MKPLTPTIIKLCNDPDLNIYKAHVFGGLTIEPIPKPQNHNGDVHWFNARIRSNNYHAQRGGE